VFLWVGVFAAVGAGAAAQALSGFGSQLLAIPLVATLVGAKAAVVGTTLAGPLLSLQVLARDHVDVAWPSAWAALAASLAGMPIGLLVITQVSGHVLQAAIGALVVLSAVALGLLERRRRTRASRRRDRSARTDAVADSAAGLVSGVLMTSTGTSGPPLVVAFHAKDMDPVRFRATLAAVFVVQSVVAILAFVAADAVTGQAGRVAAAAIPANLLGFAAGDRAFVRLGRSRFRTVVLGLLLASGTFALVAALR
jgi:uncharacterized membrane protein YfcA